MSYFSDVERDLVVAARTDLAAGVVALDLASPNGRDLPAWEPGSHIDLVLDDGRATGPTRLERQYSLCGDPGDRATWRVAVLREDGGRGGSVRVHDDVREGQRVRVRGPRNHFSFDPAAASTLRFVAGGIGITPIVGMVHAAASAGLDWTLDYAGRSRTSMAFADRLASAHPASVRLHPSDEHDRLDVDAFAAELDAGTAVYACGPARLLDALRAAVKRHGWDADGMLHLERFEAVEYGEPVWPHPFEVELALSGTTVTVSPQQSVLEAIEEQSPETLVLSSCRLGTCGTCEAAVVAGEIEHRDSVLTPLERAEGAVMMVCVSRAACSAIVLDL